MTHAYHIFTDRRKKIMHIDQSEGGCHLICGVKSQKLRKRSDKLCGEISKKTRPVLNYECQISKEDETCKNFRGQIQRRCDLRQFTRSNPKKMRLAIIYEVKSKEGATCDNLRGQIQRRSDLRLFTRSNP